MYRGGAYPLLAIVIEQMDISALDILAAVRQCAEADMALGKRQKSTRFIINPSVDLGTEQNPVAIIS